MAAGCYGPLASTIPPITFPAWSSFMTGLNPGRHGVMDFCERVKGEFRLHFYNATDIQGEPYFRRLSREGKSVALVGIPLTYPPEAVNGVVVPGFDAPGLGGGDAPPEAFHPGSLYDEIKKRFGGFWVAPNLVAFGPNQLIPGISRVKACLKNKGDVTEYLLKSRDWDCFTVVLGETDTVCHYYWRFHDASSPLFEKAPVEMRDGVFEIYRQADAIIGRLLENLPADANLILLSDHGMAGASDTVIHLNLWLAEQGFLTFKEPGKGLVKAIWQQPWFQRLLNLARDVGVRYIPHALKKLIFYKTDLASRLESHIRYSAIDWSQTLAYSEEGFQFPTIRINLKGVEPHGQVEPGEEYERLRDRLAERLLAWKNPWSGAPMVRKVMRREEVYSGDLAFKGPDLFIDWAEDQGFIYMSRPSGMAQEGKPLERLNPRLERDRQFFWNRSAKHRPDGIFLGYGPAFNAEPEIQGLRIIDLAPLILYLNQTSIPNNLDGRLPTQVLRPEYLQANPPLLADMAASGPEREEKAYTEAEAKELEERLRSLGYLG